MNESSEGEGRREGLPWFDGLGVRWSMGWSPRVEAKIGRSSELYRLRRLGDWVPNMLQGFGSFWSYDGLRKRIYDDLVARGDLILPSH